MNEKRPSCGLCGLLGDTPLSALGVLGAMNLKAMAEPDLQGYAFGGL